jgi:hypothetical protein
MRLDTGTRIHDRTAVVVPLPSTAQVDERGLAQNKCENPQLT